MDYRKFGECYYIRMDRDDEIISTILEICKKENVRSATFSGIGGCKDAKIQTFIPETGSFEEQRISGMLELVSLNETWSQVKIIPVTIIPMQYFLIKMVNDIAWQQVI